MDTEVVSGGCVSSLLQVSVELGMVHCVSPSASVSNGVHGELEEGAEGTPKLLLPVQRPDHGVFPRVIVVQKITKSLHFTGHGLLKLFFFSGSLHICKRQSIGWLWRANAKKSRTSFYKPQPRLH